MIRIGALRCIFVFALVCMWINASVDGGVPGSASIVGGVDAKPNEFAWQVAIGNGYMLSCGGALVDKYWVITARHCVTDHKGTARNASTHRIDVHVGSDRVNPHKVKSGAQIIRAKQIHVTRTAYEDMALVELSEAANLKPRDANTIRIAANGDRFMGRTCTIIGWGYTNKTSGTRSARLQKATTKIVAWSKCTDTFSGLQNTAFDICAVSSYASGCNGDSGGALVCKDKHNTNVLFGVTSAGTSKCGAGDPSIYKRVAHWRKWIRRVTNMWYL